MSLQQHRARRRSIFALALIVVFLVQASPSKACGPFSLDAVFSFKLHPEYPLEKYAAGDLGVVQPSYARSYLFVAYQYFRGSTLDAPEQQAVVELWRDRLENRWQSGEDHAVETWTAARKKVVDGSALKIDVYRRRETPEHYESYLNCQNDAFENAATTLEARIKQFGVASSAVKQWVEAQDHVFSNCSEGQHIPAALPADADEILRADRDYQIAAANFYSGNFDVARTQFESISSKTKSPWQTTAAYLVARALLRKASLGPNDTKSPTLTEAEQQLGKILANQKLASSHAAAKRLMSIVRLRLRPEARMHELGVALVNKTDSANLKQDLLDYTILLDQLGGDGEEESHHLQKSASVDFHGDDLTDWLTTYQSDKAEATEYSITRWEATSSEPWLIAALSKVGPKHEKASLLQAAAAKILPTSPAFASVAFESGRLDLAAGRFAEVRTRIDDLLRKYPTRFNRSALNLLHHQRLMAAGDLADFVAHSQRIPAGFSWDDGGREIPVDEAEFGDEMKAMRGKMLFDQDAALILDRRMPVALLREVASSNALAENLRRDVTQAAWLRSVLLGNNASATALVPGLKALVPEMTPLLNEYLKAGDPAAKKFSALYAWLKFPGLEPVVDAGSGRGGALSEQDSYRDNWWCSAANAAPAPDVPDAKKPLEVPTDKPVPLFLTIAQRATAEKEFTALFSLGAAPNYLSRQVIEWTTKNPNDPRVPEALHLVVKSTRYGCTDKQTGKWSKAAYDFLHQHYPQSTWAKQTPYWFKD